MKIIKLMLLLLPFMFSGCYLTGSGQNNNDDAYLIVDNLTSLNIYLTVDDGSLGPYPENLLVPGDQITFGWDDYDEIFSVNNGIAFLNYRDEEGNEEASQVAIFNGQTTYFTISENATVLVVSNHTNADTWFTVDNGMFTSLFSGDSEVVSFGELGYLLNVHLYYSGYHVFSKTVNLDLFPYSTEHYDIEADAGAVSIQNYGIPDIVNVYIAPSDSQYWGSDMLGSNLESGDTGFWTVEPGWWDIKTINQHGEEQEFYDRYIAIDTSEFIGVRRSVTDKSDKNKIVSDSIFNVEFKTIISH